MFFSFRNIAIIAKIAVPATIVAVVSIAIVLYASLAVTELSDTATALVDALERATSLVRDPAAVTATRRAAMARDSSWTASAHQYEQLYRSLGT